jgi:hypothetical protein
MNPYESPQASLADANRTTHSRSIRAILKAAGLFWGSLWFLGFALIVFRRFLYPFLFSRR